MKCPNCGKNMKPGVFWHRKDIGIFVWNCCNESRVSKIGPMAYVWTCNWVDVAMSTGSLNEALKILLKEKDVVE